MGPLWVRGQAGAHPPALESPGTQKPGASEHPRLPPSSLSAYSSRGPSLRHLLTKHLAADSGLTISGVGGCRGRNTIIQITRLSTFTYLEKTGRPEN